MLQFQSQRKKLSLTVKQQAIMYQTEIHWKKEEKKSHISYKRRKTSCNKIFEEIKKYFNEKNIIDKIFVQNGITRSSLDCFIKVSFGLKEWLCEINLCFSLCLWKSVLSEYLSLQSCVKDLLKGKYKFSDCVYKFFVQSFDMLLCFR